jgi:hypothetical protein
LYNVLAINEWTKIESKIIYTSYAFKKDEESLAYG